MLKTLFILLLLTPVLTCAQQGFAVVELFTSEGCSSCPVADELLNKVSADAKIKGQNIFALEYHVDYWNRLGWKDPFSKYQYTKRQEIYTRVLPEKELYTPQVIVNGLWGFTGSNKVKMNEHIEKALALPVKYTVSATTDTVRNDTLFLNYKLSATDPNYSLRIAITEDGLTSKIGSGENGGKILHHDNIVRLLYAIDNPDLQGVAMVPVKDVSLKGKKNIIVFVQHKQTLRIHSATRAALNVER
jgi:hypothetical protein